MIPVLVATIPLAKALELHLGDKLSLSWPEGVRDFCITKIELSIDGTAKIEASPKVDQNGKPLPDAADGSAW